MIILLCSSKSKEVVTLSKMESEEPHEVRRYIKREEAGGYKHIIGNAEN